MSTFPHWTCLKSRLGTLLLPDLERVVTTKLGNSCLFICLFIFFFGPHPHIEVPWPGINSEQQLQRTLQLWQCQIFNLRWGSSVCLSSTSSHCRDNTGSLTHCAIVFHCVEQSVYPFTCWWKFEGFFCNYLKIIWVSQIKVLLIFWCKSLWICVFTCLGWIHRRHVLVHMTGLYLTF